MESTEINTQVKSVYQILKYVFIILPIVAGLDKFTNILTDWTQYLNPALIDLLPVSGNIFMMIVGVIEIVAGIIVFLQPKIGGIIVAVWLVLIALSLIIGWRFVDVAVRDLVMAISACSMAKLARIYDNK